NDEPDKKPEELVRVSDDERYKREAAEAALHKEPDREKHDERAVTDTPSDENPPAELPVLEELDLPPAPPAPEPPVMPEPEALPEPAAEAPQLRRIVFGVDDYKNKIVDVRGEPKNIWDATLLVHDEAFRDLVNIDDLLGVGAMGLVWAGRHGPREVAVKELDFRKILGAKTLAPEVIEEATESLFRVFQQEAHNVMNLRPEEKMHVVDVILCHQARVRDEEGEVVYRPYLVMERLHKTLRQKITELNEQPGLVPMSPFHNGLHLLLGVIKGLNVLRKNGIVHRDLKPENIYLTENETPKIGDFGLALVPDIDYNLGTILGSPAYMSPEQFRNPYRGIDHRSDLFSLGVIMYELFGGILFTEEEEVRSSIFASLRRTFGSDRDKARFLERYSITFGGLAETRKDSPEELDETLEGRMIYRSKEIPPELKVINRRLLQARPEDRYTSAEELLQALKPIEDKTFVAPRLHREGINEMRERKYLAAYELLQRAANIDPTNPHYRGSLGTCLTHLAADPLNPNRVAHEKLARPLIEEAAQRYTALGHPATEMDRWLQGKGRE
ncbi:serine/threonine protein kinase, partial [Candidatus Woesearchaeota archaeon]|nr:serine/threonine protein kinase [Candidatus Woesearchaeota archaeon]